MNSTARVNLIISGGYSGVDYFTRVRATTTAKSNSCLLYGR